MEEVKNWLSSLGFNEEAALFSSKFKLNARNELFHILIPQYYYYCKNFKIS